MNLVIASTEKYVESNNLIVDCVHRDECSLACHTIAHNADETRFYVIYDEGADSEDVVVDTFESAANALAYLVETFIETSFCFTKEDPLLQRAQVANILRANVVSNLAVNAKRFDDQSPIRISEVIDLI